MTQFDLSTTDPNKLVSRQTLKPKKSLSLHSLRKPTNSKITILADISGSMSGDKIRELRKALLSVWRPGMEGIAFETELWSFGIDDISSLTARGSTHMTEALEEAWLGSPDRIVLLTDGWPDGGSEHIKRLVDNHPKPVIDTISIGYDADIELLKHISEKTGGKYNAVGDPLKLTETMTLLLSFRPDEMTQKGGSIQL